MHVRLLTSLLLAASLGVLGVACGGDSDSTTPTPTATADGAAAEPAGTPAISPSAEPTTAESTPTASPVPPTSTPAPTDTPEPPTETPEPPTATTAPPPAPTATQPIASGPQSLYLTAKSLKFSPTTLYARTGGSVTITLSNQDIIVPHNVQVSGLGTSATCQGPCTVTLSFLAPPPGSYGFLCTVHPYMTGTLIVQ